MLHFSRELNAKTVASVNYENVRNGMCELNRLPSPNSVMNTGAFIALPGYSFGQLVASISLHFVFLTLCSFSVETSVCHAW